MSCGRVTSKDEETFNCQTTARGTCLLDRTAIDVSYVGTCTEVLKIKTMPTHMRACFIQPFYMQRPVPAINHWRHRPQPLRHRPQPSEKRLRSLSLGPNGDRCAEAICTRPKKPPTSLHGPPPPCAWSAPQLTRATICTCTWARGRAHPKLIAHMRKSSPNLAQ